MKPKTEQQLIKHQDKLKYYKIQRYKIEKLIRKEIHTISRITHKKIKFPMKTFDQLQKQFEHNVQKLQSKCQHENISDWCEHWWAAGHGSGYEVKFCKFCNKTLQYKSQCIACGSEVIGNEPPKVYQPDWLCDPCKTKGKYYCFQHKTFYDGKNVCPKCVKEIGCVDEFEV